MRKILFSVANSLDGLVAREDHSVDWLIHDEGAVAILEEIWSRIDTIVMGRKTYEASLKLGATPESYGVDDVYVVSRSQGPDPERDRGIRFVQRDVVELLRELREQPGKDVFFMGGGEVAAPVWAAGLIDELSLNIHPVLLGRGIPLFKGIEAEVRLELRSCKTLASGCVFVTYDVLRGEEPAGGDQ